MPNKSNSKRKSSGKNIDFNSYIRIQIIALIIYLIVFFAFSVVCLSVDLKREYVYYLSLGMFLVLSFLVGFISGIRTRRNGLITGILYSLPINTVFLVISFLFNGFKADFTALITAAAMILASAAGGIVSVNVKVRK